MKTDDPLVCREKNPDAHDRMVSKDGRCTICGGTDERR